MATKIPPYRCTSCGATAVRWTGQCPTCGEWNTIEETSTPSAPSLSLQPLGDVEEVRMVATGIVELDRVLGGGVTSGSVTLVVGEPGIGKSTLCLQIAARLRDAIDEGEILIVSAEESVAQVGARARRLGAERHGVTLLSTSHLPDVEEALATRSPSVAVIDSVSTLHTPAQSGSPGSVTQVRTAAEALSQYARRSGTMLILIGHVTKDGDLAGPRSLEHLVDTVLHIEGDRHHQRRVLTTTKHRYGRAGEVGVLTMEEEGLVSVPDPSAALLAERGRPLPGSVASILAEGAHPLAVEIQALVTPAAGSPARVAQGIPATRLRQLAAVLDAHGELGLGRSDVFAACSGAIKATEPAVDMAVMAAIVSAEWGIALDQRVVCIGEVGLTGAFRPVSAMERRLREAARIGLSTMVVPPGTPIIDGAIRIEVATVAELLGAVRSLAAPQAPARERRPEEGW